MKDKLKSYCERCDFETNHEALFVEKYQSDIKAEGYDYAKEFYVVRCLGCGRISFRSEFIDLEGSYPDEYGNWNPEISVVTYPPKPKIERGLKRTYELPDKIRMIYDESISAYNANCPLLTGVAFRAIIEAICIEESISGKNLEVRINGLVRQKLITEKEAKRLHSIRFIGNDSVHEMKVPKDRSLRLVLNIVEHLLNNLYLIDIDSYGVLETVVDNYEDFEDLVSRCVKKMKKGEEIPLPKLIGKNVRRLNGKLIEFENKLIERIKKGEYSRLSVGRIDSYGNDPTQRQHFVIN